MIGDAENDAPKFMTTYYLTKNDTPKFISCSKKAPQKMARPVPVYMEVTPPRGFVTKCYGKNMGRGVYIALLRSAREFSVQPFSAVNKRIFQLEQTT